MTGAVVGAVVGGTEGGAVVGGTVITEVEDVVVGSMATEVEELLVLGSITETSVASGADSLIVTGGAATVSTVWGWAHPASARAAMATRMERICGPFVTVVLQYRDTLVGNPARLQPRSTSAKMEPCTTSI